jgi:uncharacterized protein DUF5753
MVNTPAIMHDQMMRLIFAPEYCSIRVIPSAQYGRTGAPSSFRIMSFADHGPVASEDMMMAAVVAEKPADLAVCRKSLEWIDQVALSEGRSKELIVTVADEYAWMETRQHAVRNVAHE